MNRRGFTLVELLATLVILGIIMGIVVVSTTGRFDDAKDKTEEVFVSTIEDAMDIYLDSDAKKKIEFNDSSICTVNKSHGSVKVYKNKNNITINDVINSEFNPLSEDDLVNPADSSKCDKNTSVNIYVDEDYVYYYEINSNMGCLKKNNIISNLPSGCINNDNNS